jgi:signal transduction histidine kinase
MAWELRPVPLDELGLPAAVAHYLDEWAERSQMAIDIEVKLGDRILPAVVEATVFRVLQEATTNVLKHAAATHVGVILEAAGDEVRLVVEDNGKGFPTGEDPRVEPGEGCQPGSRHLGLVGMRERLALVRGSLEIESTQGSGTSLFVRIPLRPTGDIT